jgi:NitT/TauT family transport system permease protein
MTVIKSTPVASIVMVLWIIIGSTNLPAVIGVLMVMPIIWQNLKDGYDSIDKELYELSVAYEFSRRKRYRLLVFPALMQYFIPAILTSIGLAWKSGIAAEIIAYTKNSIGKNIYDAKGELDTPSVFAWTLAVVLISIAFEFAIKTLLRRFKAYEPHTKKHN